jgi:hypothetical protein
LTTVKRELTSAFFARAACVETKPAANLDGTEAAAGERQGRAGTGQREPILSKLSVMSRSIRAKSVSFAWRS